MKKQFKHGNMRTWELVIDAVINLGGQAKADDILHYIQNHVSDYNRSNLRVDLDFASVNCASRTNHAPNKKPRKSNAGAPEDALFKEGAGRDAVFHVYNPILHGIWEIIPDPAAKSGYTVRIVFHPHSDLKAVQDNLELTHIFDPTSISDARRRIASSIVIRRGQQGFRQSLISVYSGKCAITGCSVIDVLEAAHIFPYRGVQTNDISNGILLRADIHTLFDLGLIKINPNSFTVEIDEKITNSEYAKLSGKNIHLPVKESDRPSKEALKLKYNQSSLW